MQRQQQQATNGYREEARRSEGKVTIQKNTETKHETHIDDNEGEYVDFEEVK